MRIMNVVRLERSDNALAGGLVDCAISTLARNGLREQATQPAPLLPVRGVVLDRARKPKENVGVGDDIGSKISQAPRKHARDDSDLFSN
jgi:hypothetical protein